MESPGRSDWPRTWELFRSHRFGATIVAVVSLVSGAVEAGFLVIVAGLAFALANNDDAINVGGHSVTLGSALIVAAALVAVRLVCALVSVYASTELYTAVSERIRNDATDSYLGASWALQQAERSGHLHNILSAGASGATGAMSSVLTLVHAFASLAALMVVALVIDPLATAAIALALVVLGVVLNPLRRRVRSSARAAMVASVDLSHAISELSSLGMEMQVFGVRSQFAAHLRSLVQRQSLLSRTAARIRDSIGPVYTTLTYIAVLGAVAVASSVATGDTSRVAAVMLVMLRSLSYGRTIQSTLGAFRSALPRLEVLDESMQRYRDHPAPGGDENLVHVGHVAAANVCFSYRPGEPVLQNVGFDIQRGEVVGVIGPSGSGKSTLVQLILGLREPDAGLITVGGVDLREIDRQSWFRRVAYVAQEAVLSSGTAEEAIRFFRPEISSEMVMKAARSAHIADDLLAMPAGFSVEVGERGKNLSGGQRQRVAIARALAGSPELLVMDEPTSALDVRSEALIRQTILELKGEVSILIVAHRLSTLEACDRILILDRGRVIAFDEPAVLTRENPDFQEALLLSGVRP